MIVKANDDLRQEVLAVQLMKRMSKIFEEANINCYLRPYEIFITSSSSGIIEFIPDTVSIDGLKKKFPKRTKPWSLKIFFEKYYQQEFEEAQKNFVESLAGYSLFNYLFSVKDRHNGNILLDAEGHLVHIDYGFMFQSSPGGISFEGAPFKLTAVPYSSILQCSIRSISICLEAMRVRSTNTLRAF
jgi:phosphatidylinositol kinase/protein kinase (PI-3  family)